MPNQQPVYAKWGPQSSYPGVDLTINDPDTGEHVGFSVCEFNEKSACTVIDLGVNSNYRRNKHATRLVSAAAHLAIKHGLEAFNAAATSQHTIRIFRRLFGEDNLVFSDFNEYQRGEYILPMNSDEAISVLERLERVEESFEEREQGISVSSSLKGLTTDRFEAPVELNNPFLQI